MSVCRLISSKTSIRRPAFTLYQRCISIRQSSTYADIKTTNENQGGKIKSKFKARYFMVAAVPFAYYYWLRREARNKCEEELNKYVIGVDRTEIQKLITSTGFTSKQLLDLADFTLQKIPEAAMTLDQFGRYISEYLDSQKENDRTEFIAAREAEALEEENEILDDDVVANSPDDEADADVEDDSDDDDDDEIDVPVDNRHLDPWDIMCLYRSIPLSEQDNRGRISLIRLLAGLSILAEDKRSVDLNELETIAKAKQDAGETDTDAHVTSISKGYDDDDVVALKKLSDRGLHHTLRLPLSKFLLLWKMCSKSNQPVPEPIASKVASNTLKLPTWSSSSPSSSAAKPVIASSTTTTSKSNTSDLASTHLSFPELQQFVKIMINTGFYEASSLMRSNIDKGRYDESLEGDSNEYNKLLITDKDANKVSKHSQSNLWKYIPYGRPFYTPYSHTDIAKQYFQILGRSTTAQKSSISLLEFMRISMAMNRCNKFEYWFLKNPTDGWWRRKKLKVQELLMFRNNDKSLQSSLSSSSSSLSSSSSSMYSDEYAAIQGERYDLRHQANKRINILEQTAERAGRK